MSKGIENAKEICSYLQQYFQILYVGGGGGLGDGWGGGGWMGGWGVDGGVGGGWGGPDVACRL